MFSAFAENCANDLQSFEGYSAFSSSVLYHFRQTALHPLCFVSSRTPHHLHPDDIVDLPFGFRPDPDLFADAGKMALNNLPGILADPLAFSMAARKSLHWALPIGCVSPPESCIFWQIIRYNR